MVAKNMNIFNKILIKGIVFNDLTNQLGELILNLPKNRL